MRYKDLIKFDPVETVIKLKEANVPDKAKRLVETFVISDRMAMQLSDLIFPHLQWEKPQDNKALLVVGNYGTGKSHLMSVISTIAERADLVGAVRNENVRKAAATMAGKFKAIRVEIGGVRTPLREILCMELESNLKQMGVDYKFPPIDKITNNTYALTDMMQKFEEKFPNHGLLLVVDELLDYLRGRSVGEITLDLGFLREVGEFCKDSRFRFMAGVQESLFDSDLFSHVAESLRRVRDRFEQARIVREDVAFVVSERLLQKTPEQKALIRAHLKKFTPVYEDLGLKLEEFVSLFPVHPAYLDTFERVRVAEKREILKTLSSSINQLLNKMVPDDSPGVFSFDSYWDYVRDNPSLRADPDIKVVIERSEIIEDRIKSQFSKPLLKENALRLLHALSVHRLTTADLKVEIGMSPAELREKLLVYIDVPEKDPAFLEVTIQSILKETKDLMRGSYFRANSSNGQYYLFVGEDIDPKGVVESHIRNLSKDALDESFFDVLAAALAAPDRKNIHQPRAREHEIEWISRKVTRRGYLFFGSPNERNTAQPPRGFYMYFKQAYNPPAKTYTVQDDEVIFTLAQRDTVFEERLQYFAAASELKRIGSSAHKKAFGDEAEAARKDLIKWLRDNLPTCCTVEYRGTTKKLSEVARKNFSSVDELINHVASTLLETSFMQQAPEYPSFPFTTPLTSANLNEAVASAIRVFQGKPTELGKKTLEGLLVYEGNRVISNTKYASYFKSLLQSGHVVNNKDVLETINDATYDVHYRLEPELLTVILATLVHTGEIEITLSSGVTVNSTNIDELTKQSLSDLVRFKSYKQPKGFPIAAAKALCELVSLPPTQMDNEHLRDQIVTQIQERISTLVEECLRASRAVDTTFWDAYVYGENEKNEIKSTLTQLKQFLESLQRFNSASKMRNLDRTKDEIEGYALMLERTKQVLELQRLLSDLVDLAGYLGRAQEKLPLGHHLKEEAQNLRAVVVAGLQNPADRFAPAAHSNWRTRMLAIKQSYIRAYAELHNKGRLGLSDERRRNDLLKDQLLVDLRAIRLIKTLPLAELTSLENELGQMKACYIFTEKDLTNNPTCPHCYYEPTVGHANSVMKLTEVEEALDRLYRNSNTTLLNELGDPTVQKSVAVLPPEHKSQIDAFIKRRQLPSPMTHGFVQAVQEALRGVIPITLTPAALHQALNGLPCTVEELKHRFEAYLRQLTQGKEMDRVRILISESESEQK